MAYSRTAQLATFLALTSSCAFAFAPSHYSAHRRNTATELSASNNQDEWKKVAGGAASFVTGLGFLAQVAFADPNSIATVDQTQMASVSSSNVLLSGGAPSFGGGGSFETLDFSLPSYDQATSSSTLSSPKKDVSDLFGSKSSSDDDVADAAAKEAAKKQAEAEKKQAAEEARAAKEAEKEAKAKAEADAKAEKEAKAKADEDAKAAKEAEKEARKVRRIPLPE